jgi:hypothetical protein
MRHRFFLLPLLCLAPIAALPAAGQLPGLGDVLARTPGLKRIVDTPPALTTSVTSATGRVDVLDFFEPATTVPMTSAPRGEGGSFVLEPGRIYELKAQSYCLLAGSRAPTQGDGYLDAPLAGPMSGIVQHILERSADHPEIAQQDIQMLLWSILARAKISDLSREQQAVAGRLLTGAEIRQVNGGALGLIPDAVKDAALARLPPVVAHLLSAEADLRDLIAQGDASYEEMAAIAMREPPEEAPGEDIPRERWSYRDGMYIRYLPEGYEETRIQVYVPGASPNAGVVRDDKGRLSRITDDLNRTIEITYDDAMAPRTFQGDSGVKAWKLKKIAYLRPAPDARRDEAGVDAWVLVGMPNGRGIVTDNAPRFLLQLASLRGIAAGGMLGAAAAQDDITDDLRERYDRASRHKDMYDRWKDARERSQGGGPSADDILDEGHYKDGLDKARNLDFQGEAEWIRDHNESLGRQAARIHCELTASCGDGGKGPKKFNPSRGAAVPGGTGGQRLGQSARSR